MRLAVLAPTDLGNMVCQLWLASRQSVGPSENRLAQPKHRDPGGGSPTFDPAVPGYFVDSVSEWPKREHRSTEYATGDRPQPTDGVVSSIHAVRKA